jgi:hypothetical protein
MTSRFSSRCHTIRAPLRFLEDLGFIFLIKEYINIERPITPLHITGISVLGATIYLSPKQHLKSIVVRSEDVMFLPLI